MRIRNSVKNTDDIHVHRWYHAAMSLFGDNSPKETKPVRRNGFDRPTAHDTLGFKSYATGISAEFDMAGCLVKAVMVNALYGTNGFAITRMTEVTP